MRIYSIKIDYMKQAVEYLTRIQMILYDSIITPIYYETEFTPGQALYNILSSSQNKNNSFSSLVSKEDSEDSIANSQKENYVVYQNKHF